jgi:allantoinase
LFDPLFKKHMSKLAIISNRVILPGGMKRAIVLIEDDKIFDIIDELPADEVEIVDAGNLVVMPGIIDPHVHINEPGRTDWEGFDTATKAAIAGGITSLVDMPLNALPVTTTVEGFNTKLDAAGPGNNSQLHCNCGFWGGIIPGNLDQIDQLVEKGVLGFKAFLTHSGIDEFPNVTEADLRKAMHLIAKHDLPLLVHAELQGLEETSGLTNSRSYWNYLQSRPCSWEDNAIDLMIRLCGEYNCRTHIVHLSSANAIGPIAMAKKQGLRLTVETGQHYLYFNAENIKDGETQFKCAPPIREKANNDRLWQALKEGIIDFVATDHSPAPPNMKELETGDFMNAWGGIASLQFALPALWTAAKRHGCSLENISQWLAEKPSLLPRLTSRGKIAKGMYADLVIWNPEKAFKVSPEMIYHKHKITPYLNEELFGVVEQTWLGGRKIYDKGSFIELNRGKVLLSKQGL